MGTGALERTHPLVTIGIGAVAQREAHGHTAVIEQGHTLTLDRDAEAVHLARGDGRGGGHDDLGREVVERTALVVGAPSAPVVRGHGVSPSVIGPPRPGDAFETLQRVLRGRSRSAAQASAGRISSRRSATCFQPMSIGMPPTSGCIENMAKSPAALASSTASAGESTR